MTLAFHPNIRNLYLGRGIAAAFSTGFAISVYSGAQPTAAQIAGNWTLYNEPTSNFLVHYTSAGWMQPSAGILLQLIVPPPQTVLKTGTASWAIVWSSNVNLGAVQGSTLPSTSFLVVACSNGTGQGVIRFSNPSLTAGVSTSILDGSIGAYTI